MSSKDLGQSQGDHRFARLASFLIQVLEPLKRHPDAYVYVACFAIGVLGAALSGTVAVFQRTDSQFFQHITFFFLAAGVLCSLGWAFRPWRGDLKELQQLRDFRGELKFKLTRMMAEHLRRPREHAAILYEHDLKNVPKHERDGHLDDYDHLYHDRWHHIDNVLYDGKPEPDARGER